MNRYATEIIDESGLQFRNYLKHRKQSKLVLTNGMRVLLISDPQVKKSGVSLTVRNGSLNDPQEFQGLAHLLEHAIFKGSANYPGSSFLTFVTEHGGNWNGA